MSLIPTLQVDSINVSYGDLQALWNVSFEVDEGQIVSLIGANGAGKTTTLKTITGLLKPNSGKILFGKADFTKLSTNKIVDNGVVYVPEGRGIFREMSVLENLDMGSYSASSRKQHDKSLQRVFSLFPILESRKSQSGGTLSGGESQMLAIGRGLMAVPKVLMLDEPSAGLAPIIVDSIFKTISELREQKTTILLVEQDAGRALRMSDYSYVLETGHIKASGTGEELLKSEYVREAYLAL